MLARLLVPSLWLCFLPWASAQVPTTPHPTAANYPASLNGLTKQVEKVAEALRRGNPQALDAAMKDFLLPEYDLWFARGFGENAAPQLAAEYRSQFIEFQTSFGRDLGRHAKSPKDEIQVEPVAPQLLSRLLQKATPSPIAPPPIAAVPLGAYELSVVSKGRKSRVSLLSLVYVEGAFRFLGRGARPFWLGPVIVCCPDLEKQRPQLIRTARPAYPGLAKTERIQGVVQIQVVIGTDGTIQDLEVLSGLPLLAKAAANAVRQWQYTPTVFEGKPVEVLTTIDVVFTLR